MDVDGKGLAPALSSPSDELDSELVSDNRFDEEKSSPPFESSKMNNEILIHTVTVFSKL